MNRKQRRLTVGPLCVCGHHQNHHRHNGATDRVGPCTAYKTIDGASMCCHCYGFQRVELAPDARSIGGREVRINPPGQGWTRMDSFA